MSKANEFLERLRLYIVEQTGLPKETVEAVLEAEFRFYVEHRGNIDHARDLLEE